MKFFIFILVFVPQIAWGQYNYDAYGHKINPAPLPRSDSTSSRMNLESRIVRIGEMEIGERFQTYSQALKVDDSGNTWLDPNYVVWTMRKKGDLEVIRTKLGYIVRVNYNYKPTERGYSITSWPKWERSYVPSSYIPIKALVVDKPDYGRLSPSQELTRKLQQPYNPRFTAPQVPPNPYSMENQNVRPRSNPKSAGSSGSSASPGNFILPELFDNN